VEARRHLSLSEVLDEWEANGPAMDQLVASLGDAMDPRLFIDEWTHEQDVRGTLGIAGGAD
jgi:aminoglycoside phosphotransferase